MSRPLRILMGSIGIAGHALPALALGRELRRRGHDVSVATSERWRDVVEGEGMRFAAGEDEIVPPGDPEGERASEATVSVVRGLVGTVRDLKPDVIVSDGLTLPVALAAEVEDVRHATLHPEIYPVQEPGLPPLPVGLFPPRTPLGRAAWRTVGPLLRTQLPGTRWLRAARSSLDEIRARLALPPSDGIDQPVGRGLHLVATLPQLEYPRKWPAGVHVTGPIFLDLPDGDDPTPPGSDPLVLVAPSTVKDPERRLVRVALEALAEEPVRTLVTTGGAGAPALASVPANAVVVDWASFARVMPLASAVLCGGNHGTLVRALAEGAPVIVSPALPDDAEHGARLAWAGAGLMLPWRLLTPKLLRLVARRVLGELRFAERASEIAAWSRANDGAAAAAELIERHLGARR